MVIKHEFKNLNPKTDNIVTDIRGNKGERGEVIVIREIYNLSKNNDIRSLVSIFGIDAEHNIIIYNMDTRTPIEKETDIKKAKSKSKADFMFKFIKNDTYVHCSIKCEHGAMPAILNHTPRSARVFQTGGDLSEELENLDNNISYFNKERFNKNIGEDIHIKNMNICDESADGIIRVVSYFLFDGTGAGKSKYPANSILEIRNPHDIKNWVFYNCIDDVKKYEYTKNIYDRIVLSMRDKGMPRRKNLLCEPWIFYQEKDDGVIKEKGSLHIRLAKSCPESGIR